MMNCGASCSTTGGERTPQRSTRRRDPSLGRTSSPCRTGATDTDCKPPLAHLLQLHCFRLPSAAGVTASRLLCFCLACECVCVTAPRPSQGCQDHQGREGLLPDLPGRDPEVLGLPPGHGWRLRRGRATAGRWRRASADIRPDPVLPLPLCP